MYVNTKLENLRRKEHSALPFSNSSFHLIEHLLCVRYFTCIKMFNPHNYPMRYSYPHFIAVGTENGKNR